MLDIEVKLVPWLVKRNEQGEEVSVGPRDKEEQEGQLVLKPGDYIAVRVRNKGRAPVYVTALDLGTDGSIQPVFPPRDAPSIDEYAPARIKPGEEQQLPEVVQLEMPAGREMIKIIATEEPADFSGFLYIPPGARAGAMASRRSRASSSPWQCSWTARSPAGRDPRLRNSSGARPRRSSRCVP